MKKIFLGLLIAVVLASACYGATSDDIYVRRDVFDAKMETFFERIDKRFEQLDKKIDTAVIELKGEIKALSVRVDALEKRLDERIDGLDKRIDFVSTFLYYILVLLAALLVLPYVNKWFENREARKATKESKAENFTLDDVRRLIVEEINLRFSMKPQVS